MLSKKDEKTAYLSVFLGAFIIVGLLICLAQIITQWVMIGGVAVNINWWTATIHVSHSVAIFILNIVGVVTALGLFVYDFICNIISLKKIENS